MSKTVYTSFAERIKFGLSIIHDMCVLGDQVRSAFVAGTLTVTPSRSASYQRPYNEKGHPIRWPKTLNLVVGDARIELATPAV
jgi:hypothetical protein